MKNNKAVGKKQLDDSENLVLDTAGGQMPNPDQKSEQTASEAAKVFEKKPEKITKGTDAQLDSEDQKNDQTKEKKAS